MDGPHGPRDQFNHLEICMNWGRYLNTINIIFEDNITLVQVNI